MADVLTNDEYLNGLLSSQQRQIYDMLKEGLPIAKIAKQLKTTEGLVKANITRMAGKGVTVKWPNDSQKCPEPAKAKQPEPDFDKLLELSGKLGESGVPLAMMSMAITFVRLCGSRLAAHQLIEDVYSALRAFVGQTEPDKGGEATPLPTNDKERIAFLEDNNRQLIDRISVLEAEANRR